MKLGKAIGLVAAMAALYGFGYTWRDLQAGQLPNERAAKALVGIEVKRAASSPEVQVKDTYSQILAHYYRPVKSTELKYAAMSGLMAALGDPHTVFMEPQLAEDFETSTTANFVGVGARLVREEGLGAKAVGVFEDGPAFQAGMRINDVIIAVDGKSVGDLEVEDIVKKIKGVEGTTVKLTIISGNDPKPKVLSIRRQQITIPTVEGKSLEKEKIGYMSISAFSEPTAQQFDQVLNKLEKNSIRGLVIDLRANPGGLLDSAVDLLSRFVGPNKVVVKMKARGEKEVEARTFGGVERSFRYPIMILVDEDSASAAEIFAGTMRDYQMATLVGEHTYGKASVQQVFRLRDEAFAKITIAKYFLPASADISRKVDADGTYLSGGLQPDAKVEVPLDQPIEIGTPDKDPVLKRAIQLIEGSI